ncbi:hypothetical protein ABT346_15665 [Micromonospora peucetia]|uniref:hypothetical protein n=1 Tax=Micromonospora peucetia TaxID=47871 RepID=UPI0033173BF2
MVAGARRLLVAALLGWLVLDWLLGEADRAAQPDTRQSSLFPLRWPDGGNH